MSFIHTVCNCRLTKDPVARDTKNGKMVNFDIAVNDKIRGEVKTIFADVVLFGFWAEQAEKFLRKGSNIMLTGKLREPTIWTRKDGTQSVTLHIEGVSFEFLPSSPAASPNTPDKPVNAVNYDAPAVKDDVDDFVNDLPY